MKSTHSKKTENLKGTRLLADFKSKDKIMEDNEITSSNYSGGGNENSKPGENIIRKIKANKTFSGKQK